MRDGYRHEALAYAGPDGFIASCTALAREGLDRDERLIVLAEAGKVEAVRDELGTAADDVSFVAMDEHGRNPNRVTAMLDAFHSAADGRYCLGINESVFARRPLAALREAQLAEAVLNATALQDWRMALVCLYDTAELDATSLTEMRRTHPVITGEPDNPHFEPELAESLFAHPLDPPPPGAAALVVGPGGLAALRGYVRAEATGLPADRIDDLVLAANEIATNSLQHGGGHCRVTMWRADDAVVCEVRDRGRIHDPLLGRLAPPPTASSGRGLWLANHLCDLVQIRSSEAGTVVRLSIDAS
jgi:Anti-sigma regulatory factor (Ser/Thr protein kinase)